jgi:hypothetical protein
MIGSGRSTALAIAHRLFSVLQRLFYRFLFRQPPRLHLSGQPTASEQFVFTQNVIVYVAQAHVACSFASRTGLPCMSSDWEERMQAAAAFVASVAGTPMFLDESRKQKDKVVSMLTAASVSHVMVPRYLQAVQAGGFAEGHLLEIRAALEAAAERPRHAGGYSTSGAAQQNFQSFSMFLKASQWARLRAQGGQEDPLRLLV